VRISVYGLGYVGAVSAACLAADGHTVVGVDTNPVKVDLLNQGHAPVVEAGLGELIEEGVRAGRLRATTACEDAVVATEIGLVCVGTPSRGNGSLDLTNVCRVVGDIGQSIRRSGSTITVVVRSTVLPGTSREVLQPELERSAGRPVAMAVYPEFLREGTAIRDYREPAKVVIGATDDAVRDLVTRLAARPGSPLVQTTRELAEMAKYVDNTWHALKVAFANEIGSLAKAHGLDGHQVMDILCADTTLNLSHVYLRPGFAFGGSCLPKDVRALRHQGRDLDLDLPLLDAILPSNAQQLDRAFQLVTDAGARRVGVLGLAFKAGTDDLRESPMVEVVERLIGKGYEVRIFDANVNLAKLVGANRSYILDQIPHISDLMVSTVEEVLDHARTLVIGNDDPAFRAVAERPREGHRIVDLVHIVDRRSDGHGYDGICW
jgi:GDP-mannose 6-dehydrogenase